MYLTNNFSVEELCASDTATRLKIKNEPDDKVINCLAHLCKFVLQPLREYYGRPIKISSGYRCPNLNKAVGGVANSQHVVGMAADLVIPVDSKGRQDLATAWDWFAYIRDNLEFDQLIMEKNVNGKKWIHVSFNPYGNRKCVISDLTKK